MQERVQFSLGEDAPPRAVVEWHSGWRGWSDIVVRFDGQLVGSFPSREAVFRGAEFVLPQGGTLSVRNGRGIEGPLLRMSLNGVPMHSDEPMMSHFRSAARNTLGGAGLFAPFTLIALMAASPTGTEFGHAFGTNSDGLMVRELAALGSFGGLTLLFLVLAYFIARGVRPALVMAKVVAWCAVAAALLVVVSQAF